MKTKQQPPAPAEIQEILEGPDFDQDQEAVAARFHDALMRCMTVRPKGEKKGINEGATKADEQL